MLEFVGGLAGLFSSHLRLIFLEIVLGLLLVLLGLAHRIGGLLQLLWSVRVGRRHWGIAWWVGQLLQLLLGIASGGLELLLLLG